MEYEISILQTNHPHGLCGNMQEAIVFELKRLNDDVVDNCSLKESESFKKQYAAVVVQLQEVDEQACSVPIFGSDFAPSFFFLSISSKDL